MMILSKKLTGTSVTRGFLWTSLSGLVTIGNSFLIWVVIARMRETTEVGRFTIAMGLYALFFSIVSLGLLPYLINEFSQRKKHEIQTLVASASLLLAISGALSVVLMSVTAFAISDSFEVHAASFVLALGLIPTALFVVFDAVAIAGGRARFSATVSIVENAIRTLIPLWMIWAGYDIVVICASFSLIRFVALAAYFLFLRSNFGHLAYSKTDLRQIRAVVPTFAGTITLASLNWQAPLLVLGILGSETEIASFGIASRFLIPVSILMGAYANVIQPVLARSSRSSPRDVEGQIYRLGSYPVLLALVGVVGTYFFSGFILKSLFGSAYQSSAQVLTILSIAAIPFCFVMVVARGLVAMKLQRVDLAANALGVAVSIVLGVALIPLYGAVGAAISQLSSFLLMMIIETVCLARYDMDRSSRAVSYS